MIRGWAVRPAVAKATRFGNEVLGVIRADRLSRHSLLPSVVSNQANSRYQKQREVKDAVTPNARNDAVVLEREPERRSNPSVEREEYHGKHEGSRYR